MYGFIVGELRYVEICDSNGRNLFNELFFYIFIYYCYFVRFKGKGEYC